MGKSFCNAIAAGACALSLMAGASSAATIIDQYEEVAGGAAIVGGGLTVLSSAGVLVTGGSGMASGGSIPVPTAVLPATLTLTAVGSDIVGGGLLAQTFQPLPPPGALSSYLTGAFLDERASAGGLEFLFLVTGGSAAADFGSHVIVTLGNPAFDADTFGTLPGIISPATKSYQSTLRIAEAQQAQVIPLPAGVVLLISGLAALGGLGAVRRRGA